MNLQTLLDKNNMTMYRLSQISGVPKTTINDISSGKSSIGGCKAKTVLALAKALNCTMEEIMKIDTSNYDRDTGLSTDDAYLEIGLPKILKESVDRMEATWSKMDNGEKVMLWDAYWCELYADINAAEVDQLITPTQAWYLRNKYLRMERE